MTALAQEWLQEQGVKSTIAAPPVQQTDGSVDYLSASSSAIHHHIITLAGAVPALPHEFERAIQWITAVDADFDQPEFLLSLGIFGDPDYFATRHLAAETRAVLNLAMFVAFGFGAQWLFRKMTRKARHRFDGLPMETVKDRLRVIAVRFALAFGATSAFLLGSVIALFALDWGPALRDIALGFLIVYVAIRIAIGTGDLLLAPDNERFRIIPTNATAARFWCRRLTVFAGWFALAWVIVQECSALGFSLAGVQLVGYTLGLGVVALALEAVWRRPAAPREVAEGASAETRYFGRAAANIAASIGIVIMWLCRVAAPGVTSVLPAFWLVLVLILLPPAISVSRRAVEHLLRPAASAQTGGPPSVIEVSLEHGIRALLIIAAVAVLAWVGMWISFTSPAGTRCLQTLSTAC